MKKRIALLLAFVICSSSLAFAEQPGYTGQLFPLYRHGIFEGSVALRFYDASPHVPYLGISAYCQLQRGYALTVEPEGEGLYRLLSPSGGEARADVQKGTLRSDNWMRFLDPPLPWQGSAMGMLDSGCGFVRITEAEYSTEGGEMVFDLERYGIRIYADEQDVYLPVSTLSNLLCEGADRYALYNGEALLLETIDVNSLLPRLYRSERLIELYNGKERSEDMIRQSYADLCLSFDTMFGHPGVAALDGAIAEKGLHQALTDLGEDGQALIEALHSSDYVDYLLAYVALCTLYLDDGHTSALNVLDLLSDSWFEQFPDMAYEIALQMVQLYMQGGNFELSAVDRAVREARKDLWGEKPYREIGNIAVICLEDFECDPDGWEAYYGQDAPIPDDAFGRTVAGLKRAQQNPSIDTVLFDVSANGGGSTDVMMAILSLITDQTVLEGTQVKTGQELRYTFEIDKNLDGFFDERDAALKYGYRLAVLTSRSSFSAANDFAFRMRQSGAVILGEQSGGGSCCVQIEVTCDELIWVMSSYLMRLEDVSGLSVEEGCPVDIALSPSTSSGLSLFSSGEAAMDYHAFFDESSLQEMINVWFEETKIRKAA